MNESLNICKNIESTGAGRVICVMFLALVACLNFRLCQTARTAQSTNLEVVK